LTVPESSVQRGGNRFLRAPPSRWILIALALLLGLLLIPVVIGSMLPAGHGASASAVYTASPEELWSVVSDVAGWPAWNSAISATLRQPERAGRPVWLTVGDQGEMLFVVDVAEPPRLFVTRIPQDAEIGFSGTWRYEIETTQRGARLTITERGEVVNPVFRFVALFWDPTSTMRRYLSDLGRHFGETVQPAATPMH
jgi:hypothetical protein